MSSTVRVTLRRATSDERTWIEDVHVAALGPVALVGYGWTAERLRAQFRSEVSPATCVVIATEDAAGARDVGYVSIVDRRHHWYIDAFAIAPKFQKKGVGGAALRAILDDAGILPVRLSVLRTNRARSLYLRLGFLVTGGDQLREQMEWRR
ncbi:MAG: GNAT family N-acetyltransferase [Deltaproteobacteria bacterium]|nr:GNAT family N-acetyltransferase [Deltaproteobacteria bacterium]